MILCCVIKWLTVAVACWNDNSTYSHFVIISPDSLLCPRRNLKSKPSACPSISLSFHQSVCLLQIVSQPYLRNYWSKFDELHRNKIKHNEKVCRTQDLGSYAQGQGRVESEVTSSQRSNSCLSHNSETTEANLMQLHRKISIMHTRFRFIRQRSRPQLGHR